MGCGNSIIGLIAPGGTQDFIGWGFFKNFFGFELFDSRIFLDRKIWQVFFWVARFEYGFWGVLKRIGSALAV